MTSYPTRFLSPRSLLIVLATIMLNSQMINSTADCFTASSTVTIQSVSNNLKTIKLASNGVCAFSVTSANNIQTS